MKSLSSIRVILIAALASSVASAQIGTTYCTANANSSGSISNISATGSTIVSFNDVTLGCESLPGNVFGYFITSPTQGFVANAGGSAGNVCLGGTVGRYGGNVLSSGTNGVVSLAIDLAVVPTPMGPTAVVPGDTLNFQFWHRDSGLTGVTSNFSAGLEIQFVATPVPTMVQIVAGSFSMGSNAASGLPYNGHAWQQPVHTVTITQDFWMGATEVTQGEYQGLMGMNPSAFLGSSLPVEHVSWIDAGLFCVALTAQQTAAGNVPTDFEYRLPTEAEWEYACRAGTSTEFSVGASLFCAQAHFGHSNHSSISCGDYSTTAVGSYAPNAWGLHDMHGNVWEWCLDSFDDYSAAAQTDPFITGGSRRIFRGGAWFNPSDLCRSAFRLHLDPSRSDGYLGFRVVLAPVLVP